MVALAAAEPENAEWEIRGRSGRRYLLRARPYRTGGEMETVVVVTDIDRVGAKLERAEAALHDRDTLLSVVREAGQIGIWDWNLKSGKIRCSGECARSSGTHPSEVVLSRERCLALVHAGDRERVSRNLDLALAGVKPYDTEFRVIWPDGSVHWMIGRGKLLRDRGLPLRMVGLSVDITSRRGAEEALRTSEDALRQLTVRLLAAREEERRHLAFELHDDFNQRMAMLSNELVTFAKDLPPGETMRRRLQEVHTRINQISEDLRRAAHRLYPPALEHFGLVAVLEAHCAEFSKSYPVSVRFGQRNMPAMLRGDAALCLYRVAQEALTNVARHSGATAAQVRLERKKDRVRLTISDNGKGFDPRTRPQGLGLLSIQERVRALGGTVIIDAGPGRGTSIRVEVPLPQKKS